MTDTKPTHVAYLSDENDGSTFFFGANSAEDAEQKAITAMLDIVGRDYDTDQFPTEQDWIDCCLSEGWSLAMGELL